MMVAVIVMMIVMRIDWCDDDDSDDDSCDLKLGYLVCLEGVHPWVSVWRLEQDSFC